MPKARVATAVALAVALVLVLAANVPAASALVACTISDVHETPQPNGDLEVGATFRCPGLVNGELRVNEQFRLRCDGLNVAQCKISGVVPGLNGCVTTEWTAYSLFSGDVTTKRRVGQVCF